LPPPFSLSPSSVSLCAGPHNQETPLKFLDLLIFPDLKFLSSTFKINFVLKDEVVGLLLVDKVGDEATKVDEIMGFNFLVANL
jgi:hypothetical protein